jgi:predicted nuclease of predicted toxin-antitoxin system
VKFLFDHDVPEDLSYLLEQLGHEVTLLRKALPPNASDEAVLRFAHESGCVLLTCNRDDFLELANETTPSWDHYRYPSPNASG